MLATFLKHTVTLEVKEVHWKTSKGGTAYSVSILYMLSWNIWNMTLLAVVYSQGMNSKSEETFLVT